MPVTIGTNIISKNRARKYLERQIVGLRRGDLLPPVRTLMKEGGIGRIRLDSVLDEFEGRGLIKRHPGRGIIKCANSELSEMMPFVDIVSCGLPENVFSQGTSFNELISLFTSVAAKKNHGVRLHEIKAKDSIASYEKIFHRSDVKACVFLGLHSDYLTDLFEQHGIAWISLFPNTFYDFKRAILPSDDVIRLQLEHLFSLGHKRIAYLHSLNENSPSRTLLVRREGYYRIMAEKGLRVDPKWVNFTSYNDKDVNEACEKMFSSEMTPTAIILPDPVLPSVYRFIDQKGLKVGQDISIVANDDMPVTQTLSPAVTSVHLSSKLIVEKTLSSLERVMKAKKVPDICRIPVKLIVRESSSHVNES